jgi:Fic family protein
VSAPRAGPVVRPAPRGGSSKVAEPHLLESSNLSGLLEHLADAASARRSISAATIKGWHKAIMKGLAAPEADAIGRFRGEAGLARVRVAVGEVEGTPPGRVAAEVGRFVRALARGLAVLDRSHRPGERLTVDSLAAVAELAAWAHAEWVRIHPFANGNGRTARILANVILMRHGLPPVLRLRPRPAGGYAAAAIAAMHGDPDPTALLILDELHASTSARPRTRA